MVEGIHQRFSLGRPILLLVGIVVGANILVSFNVTEQQHGRSLAFSVQEPASGDLQLRSPLVTTMENDGGNVVSVTGDAELTQSSSTEDNRADSSHRVLRRERPTAFQNRPPFGNPNRPPFGFPSPSPPTTIAATTAAPTTQPSTAAPTTQPSTQPSNSLAPSQMPSTPPSAQPSASLAPSQIPSTPPSAQPSTSLAPSAQPSVSLAPSQRPSDTPSSRPSTSSPPSQRPSSLPTVLPTALPTALPTITVAAPSKSAKKQKAAKSPKGFNPKAAKRPKRKGRGRDKRTFGDGARVSVDGDVVRANGGGGDRFGRFPMIDPPLDITEAMQP
jgi:hypothetical protein